MGIHFPPTLAHTLPARIYSQGASFIYSRACSWGQWSSLMCDILESFLQLREQACPQARVTGLGSRLGLAPGGLSVSCSRRVEAGLSAHLSVGSSRLHRSRSGTWTVPEEPQPRPACAGAPAVGGSPRCSLTLLRLPAQAQARAQPASGGGGHFLFVPDRGPWDVELLCRGPRIPQPALLQGLLWGFVCFFSPQEVPVRLLSRELATGRCVWRLFP